MCQLVGVSWGDAGLKMFTILAKQGHGMVLTYHEIDSETIGIRTQDQRFLSVLTDATLHRELRHIRSKFRTDVWRKWVKEADIFNWKGNATMSYGYSKSWFQASIEQELKHLFVVRNKHCFHFIFFVLIWRCSRAIILLIFYTNRLTTYSINGESTVHISNIWWFWSCFLHNWPVKYLLIVWNKATLVAHGLNVGNKARPNCQVLANLIQIK